jgi:hypothetical protein
MSDVQILSVLCLSTHLGYGTESVVRLPAQIPVRWWRTALAGSTEVQPSQEISPPFFGVSWLVRPCEPTIWTPLVGKILCAQVLAVRATNAARRRNAAVNWSPINDWRNGAPQIHLSAQHAKIPPIQCRIYDCRLYLFRPPLPLAGGDVMDPPKYSKHQDHELHPQRNSLGNSAFIRNCVVLKDPRTGAPPTKSQKP